MGPDREQQTCDYIRRGGKDGSFAADERGLARIFLGSLAWVRKAEGLANNLFANSYADDFVIPSVCPYVRCAD